MVKYLISDIEIKKKISNSSYKFLQESQDILFCRVNN